MLLISNNCVSGFIQRDILKQEYNNPFIWTTLEGEDFYLLIKHFNEIDFMNYSIEKDSKWNFRIVIENRIAIQQTHYKLDPYAKTLKIGGPNNNDIYYCKIWEYINDKYINRVKRMKALKEQPIFICCGASDRPRYATFGQDFTYDTLARIAAETTYMTYVSFKDMYNLKDTDNVKFIPQTEKFYHNGIDFGRYIYSKITPGNV